MRTHNCCGSIGWVGGVRPAGMGSRRGAADLGDSRAVNFKLSGEGFE